MGANYDDDLKREIIELYRTGKYSYCELVRQMARKGYILSRRSVTKVCKKWEVFQSIARKPHPYIPPKGITNEILDFIDESYEKNDELTASNLRRQLAEKFEVSFALSKIKRIRRALGWYADKTKYCQLVKERNRAKRLVFAQTYLTDNFADVIWTDECSIQFDWNGKISFHRWWEP